jgi:hypothetical protein
MQKPHLIHIPFHSKKFATTPSPQNTPDCSQAMLMHGYIRESLEWKKNYTITSPPRDENGKYEKKLNIAIQRML